MKYRVSPTGARQLDDAGFYLLLSGTKYRPGDEVPSEVVDSARNRNKLLELGYIEPVRERRQGGRRRRPEADAGLLAACLADCEKLPYTVHRIERVLELTAGMARTSPVSTLQSQGRKRRIKNYGGVCPLHPRPAAVKAAMDVERRQHEEELMSGD